MKLAGVRAVITGAGSGLGRAFAVALGRRGGKILVSDVDLAGAEETVGQVRGAGGVAEVARCDVRDPDEVAALAAIMDARFGGVDLVINNAGVAVSGSVGAVSLDDWRWAIDINLLGVVHGCHVFAPRMKAAGSGYIINVASAAGLVSAPTLGPYNATKAAVVALSETLHAELRRHRVHVTVLCPTFFATNIASAARGVDIEADRPMIERMMKRSRVQAADVAEAALEAVARNRLYCVPMRDGRLVWRMKRLLPQQLPRLASAVEQFLRGRR